MNITARVIAIIATQLNVDYDSVWKTADLVHDLGADDDSMNALIDSLSEEFELDMAADMEGVSTVGEIIEYISDNSDYAEIENLAGPMEDIDYDD